MRSSYRIVDFLSKMPWGKIITEGTFDWFPPRNDPPEARKRETVFVINDLLPFSRCFVKREWIFVISTCHANSSWWKVKEQRKSLSLIGWSTKKSCLLDIYCTKSSKWKLVVTEPFLAMMQFIERFGLLDSWRLWELLFVEMLLVRNTRQKSIKKIYQV